MGSKNLSFRLLCTVVIIFLYGCASTVPVEQSFLPASEGVTGSGNVPEETISLPPDPTGLSRHYPDFVKCAAISSPELPELTTHIEELKALGHNTLCVGQGIDRFNPRINASESAAIQLRTLAALVTFKKAGFAISLDIDTGNPAGEKEYTKLTPEQFTQIVEEEVLKWAKLAEEYQVEYFSPASEMPSRFHNLYPELAEPERQRKKIEKANEWYNDILPKVRRVFQGKVMARFGAYYPELNAPRYDVVAYTTGHSFITNLGAFRKEVQKVYTASQEYANTNQGEWWVSTYFAYYEEFGPDTARGYITLKKELRDLQDDYYHFAIEEIKALPAEQRPRGFEGGYIPLSEITKTTEEAKEVVRDFFRSS